MARKNGGIIGPANVPTGNFGSAPGVWSLAEAEKYIKEGRWPVPVSGFQVANSCRFNDDSTDYLTRTPASAGNRQIFTISFWIKRANILSSNMQIMTAGTYSSGNNISNLGIRNTGELYVSGGVYGVSTDFNSDSIALLRDPSAWYHFVVAFDTTQATETNRLKVYQNGVLQSQDGLSGNASYKYPSLNFSTAFNNNVAQTIGTVNNFLTEDLDGYLSEFVMIDGQQLDATSFGETDATTGNWVPKDVSGLTFGTNGFYLPFQNSAALGQDDSGNGNNFTVNNLTSIDQCIDSPTNNFATMNPLDKVGTVTFSNGNDTTVLAANNNLTKSTLAVSQGKWYVEIKYDSTSDNSVAIGIINSETSLASISSNGLFNTGYTGVAYYGFNGNKYVNGSSSAYGNSFTTGDIIGIALDLDNNYVYFSKNGTWQNSGDPTSGASGTGGISISNDSYHTTLDNGNPSNTQTVSWNFGNAPFTISSGNTDFSALGNFEYEVPSGYRALCTKNIGLVG